MADDESPKKTSPVRRELILKNLDRNRGKTLKRRDPKEIAEILEGYEARRKRPKT